MILRRFHMVIILFVTGIVITAILFAMALIHLNHMFTILFTGALLLLQAFWLVHYINRINATLEKFFLAIRNNDSSISYSTTSGKQIYNNLATLLDEVMLAIGRVKIEKEHQFQYLRHVMEHVDAGLIAYNPDGRIELFNRSAKRLFNDFQPATLQQINRIRPGFETELKEVKPGQRKLLTMQIDTEVVQLAVRKSCFRLDDREVHLVSFQDIHQELDQKELASWKKLIQVLRHEIMNTVSPISSLATTLSRIFGTRESAKSKDQLTEQNMQDTIEGLDIIRTRSAGLLDFVEQYRTLTRLPAPEIETISVRDLLQDTAILYHGAGNNSRITVECPEGFTIQADRKMIEQVLINLVKNSIEATGSMNEPLITMSSFAGSEGSVVIQVTDNGPGIPEDVFPDIFVPFYSTKESGSGIGLSLSRQIMDLHKGKITVHSIPGKKTTAGLVFPSSRNTTEG